MASSSKTHLPISRATLWMVSAAGLLFLIGPILAIIPLSFDSEAYFDYPMPGLSLRWYQAILFSGAWQRALSNSLMVATATTVFASLLGSAAAYGIAGLPKRRKSICIAILISPMIVPGVVVALGLYLFYSAVGLGGGLPGIILAHTVLAIPFVLLTVSAALAGFDTSLPRAAASLGANPIVVFRKIVLPILSPALVSGALFAFVTSFDEFIVTSFLAGPAQFTLPLQMWAGVHDDVTPTILAAATVFVGISILMLIAVEMLRRKSARLGLAGQ